MTTFQVREDQDLAGALSVVTSRLEQKHDVAARSAAELRSAAMPGNGFHVAAVPYGPVRLRIAAELRQLAGEEHPAAGQLAAMAAALEEPVPPGAQTGR